MPPSKPPMELQGCISRASGIFFVIFGGFFLFVAAGFGLSAGGGGIFSVDSIVGGVLGLIGLVSLYQGLRRIFSTPETRGAFAVELEAPGGIENNRFFPKRGALKQGTHGARLVAGAPPFRTAMGCGCVALFWNGIVFTIFGSIFSEGRGGDIGSIIAAVIFGGIGLAAICATIYQALKAILVGNTYVEIERELLRPGEEFRVAVLQPGDFPITHALAQIVCEEVARYRQGTNTVTVREEVYCADIGAMSALTASRNAPIMQLRATIPPTAMHSFTASHNTIRWFIRVKLDLPGRPDVNESYEFRVLPEAPRGV